MIVIKIILWVLLALLLLLVTAFSFPVRVSVKYSDNISLIVKYLFLKFPIDLNGEKKPEKKSKKAKSNLKQNPEPTKNKPTPKKENAAVKWLKDTFKERGLKGLLNVFTEIAKLAGTFLKPIFRNIVIKKLDLNVTVAFEDAAQTAINYGYFCSGIYPALAVLLRIMKYKDYSVNIATDFDKKSPEFDVYAEISLIPHFVVFGAVHALVNFIILKAKNKI